MIVKNFIKSAGQLGVAALLATLSSLLGLSILSKFFSASDFGKAYVFISVVSIIGVISTLRYEYAIVLERDSRRSNQIVVSTIIVSFIICSIIAMLIKALDYLIDLSFIFDGGVPTLLMMIASYSIGLAAITRQILIRNQSYFNLSILIVATPIIANGYPVAQSLLYGNVEFDKIISGFIFGNLIWTIYLIINSRINKKVILKYMSLKELLSGLIKFSQMPKNCFQISILPNLFERILLIYFAKIGLYDLAGAFSVLQRLVKAPSNLASQVVRPLYFNALIKDTRTAYKLRAQIDLVYSTIFIFATCVYLLNTEALIGLVLSESWLEYENVILFMLPASYLLMMTNWQDRTFDVFNELTWASRYEIIAGAGSLFVAFSIQAFFENKNYIIMALFSFNAIALLVYSKKLSTITRQKNVTALGGLILIISLVAIKLLKS